jgi:hypothetical protein
MDVKILVGNLNETDKLQLNSLCHYLTGELGLSVTRNFPCETVLSGRYVIVQMQSIGVLSICEVDVFQCRIIY